MSPTISLQVPHDRTTAIVAKTPQTVVPPEVDETPKTEAKETVDVEVDIVTKVDEPSTPVQVETETTTVTGNAILMKTVIVYANTFKIHSQFMLIFNLCNIVIITTSILTF